MKAFVITLLLGGLAAGCATIVIPHATMRAAEQSGVALQTLEDGRGLYVAHCGNCHQIPDPGTHSANEWARILPEMVGDAHLDPAEAAQVLAFLQAMSSDGGAAVEHHAERDRPPSAAQPR